MTTPFKIAMLALGRGHLGLSLAPGRRGQGSRGEVHDRDMGDDLDEVSRWGASVVVTLMETAELREYGLSDLGNQVRARGMVWAHLPIRDVDVPDADFDRWWPTVSGLLRSVVCDGGRMFVHCRGGLGRAGMVVTRLLVDDGERPVVALRKVRAVRPGAVETEAQERWASGRRLRKRRSRSRGNSASLVGRTPG